MVYGVHYDLNVPGKDYTKLIAEIKRSQDYCKILKSGWWVETNETVDQLHNRLRQHMDGSDRIFIDRVRGGEHQGWLDRSAWEWLNSKRL